MASRSPPSKCGASTRNSDICPPPRPSGGWKPSASRLPTASYTPEGAPERDDRQPLPPPMGLRPRQSPTTAGRFQAEHSHACWQFNPSPSDLKAVKAPSWVRPGVGAPTLMLFSVVGDRRGVAYQEYHGVYGGDVEAALCFLFIAMAPKPLDDLPLRRFASTSKSRAAKRYGADPSYDVSMRVIADHARHQFPSERWGGCPRTRAAAICCGLSSGVPPAMRRH